MHDTLTSGTAGDSFTPAVPVRPPAAETESPVQWNEPPEEPARGEREAAVVGPPESLALLEDALDEVALLLGDTEQGETPERIAAQIQSAVDELDRLLGEPPQPAVSVSLLVPVSGESAALEEWLDGLRGARADLQFIPVYSGTRRGAETSSRAATLREALQAAHGETVVWAWPGSCRAEDLEAIVAPIERGCCDAVYGVDPNYMPGRRGRVTAWFVRRFTGRTCGTIESRCLAVHRDILAGIGLRNSDDPQPELTAKLARYGAALYEMPLAGGDGAAVAKRSLAATLRHIARTIRYSFRD